MQHLAVKRVVTFGSILLMLQACVEGKLFIRHRPSDNLAALLQTVFDGPQPMETGHHGRRPLDLGTAFDSARFKQAATFTKACGKPGGGSGDDPFGLRSKDRIRSRFRNPTQRFIADTASNQLDGEDTPDMEARIIGGEDTTTMVACWQAFIVSTTGTGQRQTCGGVIIGSRTILTANHCTLDQATRVPLPATSFQVVIGALNDGAPATNAADPTGCAETFTVGTLIRRPDYDDILNNHDLAILILTAPINIDQKPCACTLCLGAAQPITTDSCAITGFGVERADLTTPRNPIPLKWVMQTVVDQSNTTVCPVFADTTGGQTDKSQNICTAGPAGQDACNGDDGGPLFCWDGANRRYYLAGIHAFDSATCGAGLGGQNTKVALYLQWIGDNSYPGDTNITGITVTTTIPPSTVSTASTAATATTSPGTVGPTTPSSSGREACGIPGGGLADPFGIVTQNRFKTAVTPDAGQTRPGTVNLSSFMAVRRKRPKQTSTRKEFLPRHPLARIIGGTDTTPALICWQAFVTIDQGDGTEITCGGVIVGSQTILTAGTCMVNANGSPMAASAFNVIVGAIDNFAPGSNAQDPTGCAETFAVQAAALHPGYVYATSDNDIGMLTLATPIDLLSKPCACAICLTDRAPAINEMCVISGYGSESNGSPPRNVVPLKWVTQTVSAQDDSCSLFCAGALCTNTTSYICTKGGANQDQCLGDNGGPLFCYNPTDANYYLAGVISFTSVTCGTAQGAQNVRVALFLQWIADNSLAGDVLFTTPSVVTKPTPPPTTTTPATTTTTTPDTTTSGTTVPVNCGLAGTGVVDPFGLATQFRFGSFKRSRMSVFPTILGGTRALPKEICWQVMMAAFLSDGSYNLCGGVLVGSRTILSAGHCTLIVDAATGLPVPATSYIVWFGTDALPPQNDTSGCMISAEISQVVSHPNFNPNNLDNDIGMIILTTPINIAGSGGCYCTACLTDRQPATGESCAISGYGQQTTDDAAPVPDVTFLSWVTQPVLAQSYDGSCFVLFDTVTQTMTELNEFICAGGQNGKDSCHGDSGGPMVCFDPTSSSHYLAGLVSFGNDPCGQTNGSQYIKVARYLDWIQTTAPAGDVTISLTGATTTLQTTMATTTSATATAEPSTLSSAGPSNVTSPYGYPDYYQMAGAKTAGRQGSKRLPAKMFGG